MIKTITNYSTNNQCEEPAHFHPSAELSVEYSYVAQSFGALGECGGIFITD